MVPDAGIAVVGVDGSEQSVHALRWAHAYAAAIGAAVRAVMAWQARATWSDMLRSGLPASAKGRPATADAVPARLRRA
jgi:nucleotide-binding universal stress UspA family protein